MGGIRVRGTVASIAVIVFHCSNRTGGIRVRSTMAFIAVMANWGDKR